MKKNTNKYYVYAITAFSIVILAYSIWILQSAMQGVIQGTNTNVIWEVIIGLIGIGLALSTLMRVRGRILTSQKERKIVTVIECPTCKIKKIKTDKLNPEQIRQYRKNAIPICIWDFKIKPDQMRNVNGSKNNYYVKT